MEEITGLHFWYMPMSNNIIEHLSTVKDGYEIA
jgi:hypothetical protein